MPPLSRLDLPGVVASIRELYRVIEQGPTVPYRLIDEAARAVLNWFAVAAEHPGEDCSRITDSGLDLSHKVTLIELRERLKRFQLGLKLVKSSPERLQTLLYLGSVLQALQPAEGETAGRASDQGGAGGGGRPVPTVENMSDRIPIIGDRESRLLPAWVDGRGETGPIPAPPGSLGRIPTLEIKEKSRHAWTAAARLDGILNAWCAWWLQLRETGDADPGVAFRYREEASKSVHVLCALRVNAPPFSSETKASILDMLPPAPFGPPQPITELEWDGKGSCVKKEYPSWQNDPKFLNAYWGCRSARLHRLIGEVRSLMGLLRDYPVSVFESPADALAGEGKGDASRDPGEEGGSVGAAPSVEYSVAGAAQIAACNSGIISRAVDNGKLKSNGMSGRARRVDAVDLTRWMKDRAASPEADESDAAVQRKMDKAAKDARRSKQ